MGDESSSDVAAAELDDEDPSVTAVAEEPAVTRERAPEVKTGDLLAGRYQIEAMLGKGGSGVVLRAYDRVSATVVAVKVLKPGLTHDPRWEKRFQRELRLGRPVRHPNVCRIFDIGDADGYRFLTMEYATGGTLRDLIKKGAPLRPLQERLADAAGVIAGLAAIHGAGIVHRDVKPDNVLRMDDGRLVLSDFGLATDLPDSTMVSVFVGTPHYMAPEVREGDPATTRSDVWSLGVVLHEIFFGRRPEKRSARSASGVSKSSTASTSSTLERAMFALCTRCLADDPADRPEGAHAVEKFFEAARRSPHALLRSPRGRQAALLAVVAGVVATGVGIGVRTYRRSSAMAGATQPGIPRLVPTGEPADWTKVARVVATAPGHAHCFSLVDDSTVRVIWGSPRKAEDINVDTGVRRVAPLVPEAYSAGCPDISPDGRELLFTASTSAGGTEIRHSGSPDGRNAKAVTAGSDPVWLKNGEEFAYSIDSTHAAVFSLATMRFRLLADPGLGGLQTVLGKSASRHSDAVAVMVYANDVQWALSVYEGPGLDKVKSFALSPTESLRFSSRADSLFMSVVGPPSPLASFDWRTGNYRKLGTYADIDIVDVLIGGEKAMLLGRRRATDVWLYDGSAKRRLTSDGANTAAAISTTGDLLLARHGSGVMMNIWSQDRAGVRRQLTNGQLDTAPDFSPDGTSWVYADYPRKSIVICKTATDQCRILRRDDMLPAWPRFSQDGSKVAYVRQSTVPRMMAISISDGKEWALGNTHWQCPPVWSSAREVWGFEGTAGHYVWVERDVETGLRTGRRVEVKATQDAVNDDIECWPRDVTADSPFFRKIRLETEEATSVLRLPAGNLVD
jgi:serine/threonine-protein kinase